MQTIIRRILCFFPLVCLSCVAQSLPPDVVRKVEHQVRVAYKIPADVEITITSVNPSSDIPGFDALSLSIDSGDKRKDYPFLLSKDHNTLIRLNKFDLSKDAFDDVMSKIDITGRPVRGAKSAKVVLVVFDDFECPFCARAHQTLFPGILKEYGDRVSFIYKDDPLESIHPWAVHAAVDANCLAAQSPDAYWDFADTIHAQRQEVDAEKTPAGRFEVVDKLATSQGEKHNLNAAQLQSCIKAQDETAVRKSMEEAKALGTNGTVPAIFVNGQRIDGAVPVTTFRAALDRALKESANPVDAHATASPTSASK
jgi:protein-disulfide isomerase